MKPSSRILTVATVLVLSIGCDQLLKQVARALLRFHPPISILNDFIILQYAENRGVMLSIGASLSPDARFWIFVVAVGLLLLAMLIYVLVGREIDRIQAIAWTLIVSGGMGNLIDRMLRDGVVIDFVSVGFGVVRTAVFNLADLLVFVGVFVLLIHSRGRKTGPESAGPNDQSATNVLH